jgi:hypothetical protein
MVQVTRPGSGLPYPQPRSGVSAPFGQRTIDRGERRRVEQAGTGERRECGEEPTRGHLIGITLSSARHRLFFRVGSQTLHRSPLRFAGLDMR